MYKDKGTKNVNFTQRTYKYRILKNCVLWSKDGPLYFPLCYNSRLLLSITFSFLRIKTMHKNLNQ